MKCLAIDVGNSRIKWGIYSNGWLQLDAVELAYAESLQQAWSSFKDIDRVIAVNVAGPHIQSLIENWLNPLRSPVEWVVSAPILGGIKNGYLEPEKLGIDRLVGMIAAWHHSKRPVVVVACGTAITVDAVDHRGHFLGGLILPGKKLGSRSLAEGAYGLEILSGQYSPFPVQTGDAIYSGLIEAVCGAVERMAGRLQVITHTRPSIILGGGDAGLIGAHLQIEYEYHEYLVLNGLVCIRDEPDA
ncbi:MAG: type III pantothenate kinase [Proteobacteria bacterium]|nr:type III pantothenate kinase [Pseudomonadota bacterium]MDE3208636.1 type III pantothenate kinase [Pseudomonadota bacterium]